MFLSESFIKAVGASPVPQWKLAAAVGLNSAHLSHWLNKRRPVPQRGDSVAKLRLLGDIVGAAPFEEAQ